MRPVALAWLRLAALGAYATALACAPSNAEECSGELVASLTLQGMRDDGATGCVAPPAGGWDVPPTLAPFAASFRQDAATGALAYCTSRPHAVVLHGVREGDHLRAEVALPGAVLGACAATCSPLMTVTIEGDLAGGGAGPPTFTGALTETYDGSAGACGACVLPCTSRYSVTSVSP